MNVEDVFTPNSYPTHTYVEQQDKNLENKLERGLATPGAIIVITGPSKSGKTVLIRNVIDNEGLVVTQGSGINSLDDLWSSVLDELGVPTSTQSYKEENEQSGTLKRLGSALGITGIGNISGDYETRESTSEVEGEANTFDRRGRDQVVDDHENQDFVILIDDFHYIDREVQKEITESIKEASRQTIPICIALVPHRSDDIVRGNPDLRGRVNNLEVGYWDPEDLKKIAEKGFDKLNLVVEREITNVLSREAAGSPQLMQQLSLNLCYDNGVYEKQNFGTKIDSTTTDVEDVLYETVGNVDHGHTYDVLDSGPEPRGTKRNTYTFETGEGDVYTCILRALRIDPPKRTFDYDDLKVRTTRVCSGKSPDGPSILRSCKHMESELRKKFPEEHAIDWDETKRELHIPDPYFLFYIRWSQKLD